MEDIDELRELKLSIFSLRKIYDKVEEDVIKSELKKIIVISDNVYKEVLKNTEKIKKIKNFVNYYIVTIIKILDKYCYLKKMKVGSNESEKLYKKVKEFLPNVVQNFEKLYQALFNDEIIDVDAEIQVMLKQMKI